MQTLLDKFVCTQAAAGVPPTLLALHLAGPSPATSGISTPALPCPLTPPSHAPETPTSSPAPTSMMSPGGELVAMQALGKKPQFMHLLVVAQAVGKAFPNYALATTNCYYFSSGIWDYMQVFRPRDVDRRHSNHFGHFNVTARVGSIKRHVKIEYFRPPMARVHILTGVYKNRWVSWPGSCVQECSIN